VIKHEVWIYYPGTSMHLKCVEVPSLNPIAVAKPADPIDVYRGEKGPSFASDILTVFKYRFFNKIYAIACRDKADLDAVDIPATFGWPLPEPNTEIDCPKCHRHMYLEIEIDVLKCFACKMAYTGQYIEHLKKMSEHQYHMHFELQQPKPWSYEDRARVEFDLTNTSGLI
jgi:hypothetical protein